MNYKVVAAVGTVAGLAVGAAAGYFLARRQLEAAYADLADKEVEQAREFYKTLYKADEDATPEGALAKRVPGANLDPVIKAETPERAAQMRAVPPPVAVMEKIVQGLNYGAITRTGGSVVPEEEDDECDDREDINTPPKIISISEYHEGATGYTKVSLTYYAEDDLLMDSSEFPIDDVAGTIGENTLEMFGRRSRDKDVVYVRNFRNGTDFEITRKKGSFAELAHGIKQPRSRVKRMPREL